MFRKNTAGQFIHFQGVDASTGGIKSGVSWTVRRCIDGTFAAATGTVTEDGTTGWYKFAMSQADTNGNNIAFNFTGSGAVPQTVNIVTTACDPTSTAFGLSLAKTTNLTGFNDLSAAQVNAEADTALSDYDPPTRTELTTDTTSILSKLLKYVQLLTRKDAAIATDNATEVTAINANEGSGAGSFSNTTDAHEAIRDRGDAAWVTATGFSTLDASGIRSAVGLASANLDTQLTAIVTDTAEIGAAGAGLTAVPWNAAWDAQVESEVTDAFNAYDPPTKAELDTAHSITDGLLTTVDTVVDAIKAKTDSLTFTKANELDSNLLSLNGDAAAAATLAILNGATVVYQGTVTGAATTTTLVDSGLTQADTDWWKGRIIIFTSVIPLQATDITGFTPATDTLTFTATTQAPTGATYVII